MTDDQQVNLIFVEEDNKNKEKPCSSKQAIRTSRNLAQTQKETDNLKNLEYSSANGNMQNFDRGSPELATRYEMPSSSKQATRTSQNLAQTSKEIDNLNNLEYSSANGIMQNIDGGSAGSASRKSMEEVPANTAIQNTEPISELPAVPRKDISCSSTAVRGRLRTTPRRHKGKDERTIRSKKHSVLQFKSSIDNVRNTSSRSDRKRRGKPSCVSNTKRVKKPESITNFYDGKLYNVVPFGRYYVSSDSDSDL